MKDKKPDGKKINKSQDLINIRCPTSAASVQTLRTALLTKTWTGASAVRAWPAFAGGKSFH